MKTIPLALGAMAEPLQLQLRNELDGDDLAHFELDRVAIARLKVRGLLSERETDRARMRLCKEIQRAMDAWAKGER